ncbi:MAG TPA: hypothetical protein VN962_18030 [Polyangia bacterium]|nr:hypothetical protein [Polyangia bacterium]
MAGKPWDRKNPKRKSARTPLTAAGKRKARARANAAGRRYPNLVDNMWAAQRQKPKRSRSVKNTAKKS